MKSLTSNYTIPALEGKKEKGSGKADHELWLSRLSSTLQWRMNYWNGDKHWNRAYDMFRGIHWKDIQETDPSSDQLKDRITVNVTQSSVLNIVPFLMTSHPEFQGKARKPSKTVSVQLQTARLNYEYQQRDMNIQVKKSVYDAVICGHGVCKVGYTFEIDEAKAKSEGALDYASYITQDKPFVKRVSPFFFLIDPTASENNLETARWCAEVFFKTERDIIANERYDASVRNKIKNGEMGYTLNYKRSSIGMNATDQPFLNNLSKETDDPNLPESMLGMLFEVWDKKYKKYYVFADGVCEPLIEKDWPYDYIDNFPYVKLDYIALPDELYGIGIPYQIEDQQFELNRNRTYAFEHRRRFSARKFEVLNNVDEGEVIRMLEGEDGAVIKVPQIGSVRPIEDAPMPQDTQIVEGMIRGDIQEMTGLDTLLRGGQLPSRTTSGEVSTRTSLFRLKLDDRVEVVDNFILKVATQVLQHIKANFNTEQAIELVGEQGAYWETLTPEMIKEEIDISMETVSAPKVDPLLDRQQRLQIWQIAQQSLPLIQAGMIKIDMNALFGWIMEGFGIKDIGRFYNDALIPQPPLQEQPAGSASPNGGSPAMPESQAAPDFNSMFQQVGGGAISNGSGLQLG
jgi:hypothetical protein